MRRGARLALTLPLVLLAVACQRQPPVSPHYVLGDPYQAGGAWYYPRESYDVQETGLATIYSSDHPSLTSDGEAFDQSALAAAHQTVQLPAIARLTNLENGLQVVVRINDRGPATPHRLIEVTRRTATLLRFPSDAAVRVRLEVLPAESRAAVEAAPGAPKLDLVAAPRREVQQMELPPPGTVTQTRIASPVAARPAEPAQAVAAIARLPEVVAQGAADPGRLFVQLGTFHSHQYAAMQRARVARLGAVIAGARDGRTQTYRVMIGPIATVQQADIVLDQVLGSGVTDARIVVE